MKVLLLLAAALPSVAAQPGGRLLGETSIIQARIDAASATGGGCVRLARGDHEVGTLFLKSGVRLHLEAGARLVGSRDPEDYVVDLSSCGLAANVTRRWSNSIIRIVNANDVAITGEAGSEICGRNCYDAFGEEGFRGPHAITAFNVTNLFLSGYTVRDAGNFSIYAWKCSAVHVLDVEVHGGHDGFDFFFCRDVLIEKCRIYSGDDCVAGFANRFLTVRDCMVNSACSYFRLGGNDILVENCCGSAPAENPHRWTLAPEEKRLETTPAGSGRRTTLSVFTYFVGKSVKNPAGKILFRNCRFSGVDRLIHYNLSGNERWQVGRGLKDVTFENVTAEGLSVPLVVYGTPEVPLELSARKCRLTFREKVNALLRGGHVGAINMTDVSVENLDGSFFQNWTESKPQIRLEDTTGVPSAIEQMACKFVCETI